MSEKITFKELVDLIAKQSDQSQSSANSFISELVQIIESGLKSEGQVSISGFGKFELRWMNERLGTNPQTGEEITIPGQNKVVFKPYKALREDVNAPYSHLKSEVIKVKEEKSKEVVVPLVRKTGSDESVDDLIFEKEHPYKKPKEDSNLFTTPASASTTPKQPDPALIREVQDKGTFNWSFAAAGIIALLAFLLLFYLIQRTPVSETPSLTNQTEESVTVEPEPTQIDQTTPEPVAEAEPDLDNLQTEFEFQSYQINPGESLWTLAETELGNPYLWPVIYHVNRDLISNPNDIPISTELDIPIISDPNNLTEFESNQVALGYFDLYEWNRTNNPEQARFFLWAVGVFSIDLLENLPSEVSAEDLAFATSR
tara:strand:- start:31919 stop:33031 length:1113 start_codon:yes stop_codon:yes gene_type:complete